MPQGYLALVLHAHLPFVRHPEYDEFLEEDWFFEAITETYIPLVNMMDGLHQRRLRFPPDHVDHAAAGGHAGRRTAAEPLPAQPRQDHRARAQGNQPHQGRPPVPRAGLVLPASAGKLPPRLRRQVPSQPPHRLPQVPGRRQAGDHHLRRHARLPAADERVPRGGARADHDRARPLPRVLRARPARHLAAGMRLRPRHRQVFAGGEHPLVRRRHPRHHARRAASALRRLRADLHPFRPRRLRARHRVERAGLVLDRGLSRRPQLPRLLPRHRLRPRVRLHQALRPVQRPAQIHRPQVPPHHRPDAATRSRTAPASRANERPTTPATSSGTAPSRSSTCTARSASTPSSSRPTTRSFTATGGTRAPSSSTTFSARRTTTRTSSRPPRRANISRASPRSNLPRPARRPGARRATTRSGSTTRTRGSIRTCTSRPAA